MENKPKIFAQLLAVQKEITAVGKNGVNTAQNFKFRSIDDVLNVIHPALNAGGVIIRPVILERTETVREVERRDGKKGIDKVVLLKVRYIFSADDGSETFSEVFGEAADSGDKATNKAMTAAYKYMLVQTFSIPTKDLDDSDSGSDEEPDPEAATDPQKNYLRSLNFKGDLGSLTKDQAKALIDKLKNGK